MMTWYQVKALADKKAVINIYEQIGKDWWDGSGVTAKSFSETLQALGDVDQIDLHINSPGGNVYDGLTVYNLLKRHKASITGYVDGVAASIASVILMACDKVIMPENATIFVHDPSTFANGDADQLRAIADDLDKVAVGIVSAYRDKTGLDADKLHALMKGDSLLTAKEAVELGFADELEAPIQAAANFDIDATRTEVGEQLRAFLAKQKPTDPPAPIKINIEQVMDFLSAESAADAVKTVLAKFGPQPLAAADATEVIALCEARKLDAHAAPLIKAKLPKDQVTARLDLIRDVQDMLVAANVEPGEIFNHLDNPTQMMRIAVTNAIASRNTQINPNNPQHQQPLAGKLPSRANIYASRRQGSK
jgi:ATP-dependent protease ClpP protease subunit